MHNKQIAAAVIGNALEWYDFVIYGFFTLVLARNFFPAQSPYASLLLTTATFGVGFFMRPVGGVLIGVYADKKGRKAALQLIITLMTVSMAIMAFTPTYAQIGLWAPLLMVVARLLQGLATGGEFASATAFLVEMAPGHRQGLYGSLQMLGQTFSVVLGALWGAIITQSFSPEEIEAYAFRIPFAFGLLIAPVGIYIRRHLNETEAFEDANKTSSSIRHTLKAYWRGMLVTGALTVSLTITFYVLLVHMPTYAHEYLGLPLNEAFLAQLLGLLIMSATVLISGHACDRIQRSRVLAFALGSFFVALWPFFFWMTQAPSFFRLALMQCILCGLAGMFTGPISATVAEQFPVVVRSTGISIGYNLAVTLFGGFATFAVTWLIHTTNDVVSPVYYVMFGAFVGFLGALFAASGTRAHMRCTESELAS